MTAVKQFVMFLYCRGLLSAGAVTWLFRVLKLRGR